MLHRSKINKGKITLGVIMLLTLVFIFSHSLMPPEASQAESDTVGGVVSSIFSTDTAFGAFLQTNISNIAHFCEYGVLGAEISLAILLWGKRKIQMSLFSPLLAVAIAFADETVQLFSGRTASLQDMWIDVFGFCTVYVIVAIGFLTLRFFRKGRKKKSRSEQA